MNFADLGLPEETVRKLEKAGYEKPTKVQEEVIPAMLEGKQVLVLSRTGSGKTASFLLPLQVREGRTLIITPTRELALQIKQEAMKILHKKWVITVYGGTSIEKDEEALRKRWDILVATPGRCLDHIRRGNLEKIDRVILDEADKMLEMGFIEDIQDIIANLNPKEIHLFSATANRELREIQKGEVEEIFLSEDRPDIEEEEVRVERRKKLSELAKHLSGDKKTIIFMATKRGTEWLAERLSKRRIRCVYINGDMSQRKRERAIEAFKTGRANILIATDVVARGIHVDNVDLVINYDQARDPKTHKHRIGRTGRMGNKGKAITFIETLPTIGAP